MNLDDIFSGFISLAESRFEPALFPYPLSRLYGSYSVDSAEPGVIAEIISEEPAGARADPRSVAALSDYGAHRML